MMRNPSSEHKKHSICAAEIWLDVGEIQRERWKSYRGNNNIWRRKITGYVDFNSTSGAEEIREVIHKHGNREIQL
jgi:hypothetical protein